jgi:uncharacterized membrane protein
MSGSDADVGTWAHDRELAAVIKRVGAFCSAHAPILLGTFTALVYGIGLFRTLTQLHAAHVQSLRGLPLAPLQGYFIAGLAVILDPDILLSLLLTIVTLIALRVQAESVTPSENTAPAFDGPKWAETLNALTRFFATGHLRSVTRREMIVAVLYAIPLFLLVVNLPFAIMAASAAALVPFLPLGVAGASQGTAPRVSANVLAGLFIIAIALSLATFVYVAPPSLDHVTIRATNGRYVRAELLTQTSSMVYVIGPRDKNGDASIIAFPTGRIARMEIGHGEPRHLRSLVDSRGFGFFRLPDIRHRRFAFDWP